MDRLIADLGADLYSCILYGSTVRGGRVAGLSDTNLLLVLRDSKPEAHRKIADILAGPARVSPFVLGLRGLRRSQLVFAVKFRSIQRNYRVLHGVDVLADFAPPIELLRFLCEQSLRNLRLRLKFAYIASGPTRERFIRALARSVTALMTDISEALRCANVEIPKSHADRIPAFERVLGTEASVLRELLSLKRSPQVLKPQQADELHARVFRLQTRVLDWMEEQWPKLGPIPAM